ncbi:hypothetical protein H257_09584 [Aphanomyces astaci]|uniref:Uncharacterized protein n=1 Tax=Aphanomyces astaci TaxID=112090 RepID=W4GBE6_APHAT|nr:hypothetical protein H257_09584 [Aphanomyces astaci]ETV76586.1 hypothetical protein H257_09584 [Aphanomyces astaci]|eukprot:XP_009834131.1 hypothetical protein H257_09584 [Aphanomyces astaci]
MPLKKKANTLFGAHGTKTTQSSSRPPSTWRLTHLGRLLTFQKIYHLEPKEFCVEKRPDNTRPAMVAHDESHIHAQVGIVTDMLDVAIVNQGESNGQE